MKSGTLALVAILLWVITIAIFGWFFVRGSTTSGTDNRTAIVLQAGERDLILSEMRGLLASVQGIVQGATQENPQQIAQAARAAGMASAADVNPALMARLPLPFKSLGMSVHEDMDALAAAAEAGQPVPELMKMLSATLGKCVSCHANWQLQAGGA
jgi:cytochrome c556